MKIACLCPTYCRPQHLQNVLALFRKQNTEERAKLFVLDDAGQHHSENSRDLRVESTTVRYHNLPAKFNRLARLAHEWGADVVVVWEDDDVYLPHHLHDIATAVAAGAKYVAHEQVWSTYGQPHGYAALEPAQTRFHASWACTMKLFHEVGGWPTTRRLDFDQQFGGLLRQAAGPATTLLSNPCPGYVYRWGNGVYHGSQFGEGDWYDHVGELGLDKSWRGHVQPQLDQQTEMLLENLCQPSAS